ncbi:MAG: YfhO family protein [Flavobacteriia bacterium]|nr:YfhO family protein [Flavobacteriia bacterium]
MKTFLIQNKHHFIILTLFVVITLSYFKLQLSDYNLKQHDIEQHKGMSREIVDYRERNGEETLWTNSMFGGMPSVQISLLYHGNYFKDIQDKFMKLLPPPAGVVLLYMIGFYFLCICFCINPWIGFFGALAFAFSTYDLIILQAGHNSKALAVAMMAPVVGSFYWSFKRNMYWGFALSALFMNMQIAQNHLQVTYYLIILLIGLGLLFFIESILKKEILPFVKSVAGIAVAYLIALMINYGNISLTSDYAKHTIRGGNDLTLTPDGLSNKAIETGGLDKEYITQWSYGVGESFTLLSPYVKGGGTVALQESPFAEDALNSDLTSEQLKGAMNYPVYWGDQPITSGPVYLGIVVVFLAFLSLFFSKSKMKWAFLGVSFLALFLSWGKNWMGFTEFFLDNIPGYNKFRAVTIILVLVELCIPILAVIGLQDMWKNKITIAENKKKFFIITGSFIVFLFLVKLVGLKDNYTSKPEIEQQENIEEKIKSQLAGMDPNTLKTQYNLDVNDANQVNDFVGQQAKPYRESYEAIKQIRKDIFSSSMNRSILFSILTLALLYILLFTSINSYFAIVGIGLLICFDLIPVSYQYLGNQETENAYKYWELKGKTLYPISVSDADKQIMEIETTMNPKLKTVVEIGEKEGNQKANELGYSGNERQRVIDAYRFSALNRATNYRVFDMSRGFGSADPSYFHKSLGGYHGAKLRNIQNVYEFHLTKGNNKVFDMLNVKYFIQQQENSQIASPNNNAMGNAWLVQQINTTKTPDDEIRSLGNVFEVVNIGQGKVLVNNENKTTAKVFGSEKVQYLLKNDSLDVRLSNGMTEGMEAVFVMDIQGNTNLVPKITLEMDTAQSFLKLCEIKVKEEFKPKTEALMLESQAKGLKNKQFNAQGTIKMKSYAPNKITYEFESQSDQFAVFSEIYYPEGWTATIDGKESQIYKVNYLLRGLEVPKGKHQIEFKFYLPKYDRAANLARVGNFIIFILFAFLIFNEYKKRKNKLL